MDARPWPRVRPGRTWSPSDLLLARCSQPPFLGHLASFVHLDDARDQLQLVLAAGDPDVAVLIGVAPVLQPSVLGQLVEVRPRGEEYDLRVAGRVLLHVDVRERDPPRLSVAPRPQVETHDQLQLAQCGYLLEE